MNMGLEQSLQHPFILLIAGAVISGLLIPFLTRRWQDHQKELEIKIDLVNRINEAVSSVAASVQFSEMVEHLNKDDRKQDAQKLLDQAFLSWEKSSAIIGAELRAYFPKKQFEKKWATFYNVVLIFYSIAGTAKDDIDKRQALRAKLESYFRFPVGSKWQGLSDHYKQDEQYMKNLVALKKDIIKEKDNLVRNILKEHIQLFSPLGNVLALKHEQDQIEDSNLK